MSLGSFEQWLFGVNDSGGDTLTEARTRSMGVDPATGDWISPLYQNTSVALGNGADAQQVTDKAAQQVDSEFATDFGNNFHFQLPDVSAFPWKTTALIVGLIFLFLILHEARSF